ncbi:MAG TPA: hypothetical protein VGD77_15520 [Gemmatimonadaceae bacterium]
MTDRIEALLAEMVELQRRSVANQEAALEGQRQAIETQQLALHRQRGALRVVFGLIAVVVLSVLVPWAWSWFTFYSRR